jgi:hypothetical protein
MRVRALLLGVAVILLAACEPAEVEETPAPDPAAIPSGSPAALGATATGPITELGSGVMSGLGWRLLAYPTDSGWCTQLETAASTVTDCTGVVTDEESAFGRVTRTGRVIHGVVTPDATTVWLIVDNTPTVPALLMPLGEAGLEGDVAFVGIAPTGAEVSHVMAVRLNGEVLGTQELP